MILITTTINSSSSIRNRFEKLTMTTIGTLGANLGNSKMAILSRLCPWLYFVSTLERYPLCL